MFIDNKNPYFPKSDFKVNFLKKVGLNKLYSILMFQLI